jgi:hypothetical protein
MLNLSHSIIFVYFLSLVPMLKVEEHQLLAILRPLKLASENIFHSKNTKFNGLLIFLKELADYIVFNKYFSEPMILQKGKSGKISGPLIL